MLLRVGTKDMVVLSIATTMNASTSTNAIATEMDFIPMLNIPASETAAPRPTR